MMWQKGPFHSVGVRFVAHGVNVGKILLPEQADTTALSATEDCSTDGI